VAAAWRAGRLLHRAVQAGVDKMIGFLPHAQAAMAKRQIGVDLRKWRLELFSIMTIRAASSVSRCSISGAESFARKYPSRPINRQYTRPIVTPGWRRCGTTRSRSRDIRARLFEVDRKSDRTSNVNRSLINVLEHDLHFNLKRSCCRARSFEFDRKSDRTSNVNRSLINVLEHDLRFNLKRSCSGANLRFADTPSMSYQPQPCHRVFVHRGKSGA
jgi:hypothetical protein